MNTDELKTILEQHKLWLEDEGGARADLRCADLQDANLRGADLQRANLRGADLQGAILRDANLLRANLRGADLQGAILRDANLQDANLRYADLRSANLRGANLRGANLDHANLRDANLQGADLRSAILQDADLRSADLRSANLRDANLQGAILHGANMRGADLLGADLDFSCLPLWCGSKGMIVDKRIAAQIAAHFCALDCDDADYLAARKTILEFAKTSHRAGDLGMSEKSDTRQDDKWIPVSERMPDNWESVLTIDISDRRGPVTAFYNPETSLWSTDFSCDLWVTHWMPLPESPIVYGKEREDSE